MQIQTLLLIILAVIIALVIVWFQYFYKNKKRDKTTVLLSFLRFTGVFSLFLLLINPKFKSKSLSVEKVNLTILVDNSSSVAKNKASIQKAIDQLKSNDELADKFAIKTYQFGESIRSFDSLSFSDKKTDISNALKSISEVYSKSNTVAVLLSDGNQTIGQDYEFYSEQLNFPIYPIIVGDTTKFEDVRISQVNANKYAFLKNKFPIEFYVSYQGNKNVSLPVNIAVNGKNVYKEQVKLSNSVSSKKINTLISATEVGVKTISINVGSLENEKNIVNNKKTIAVEVIDEKTKVAIVSTLNHPDIGALKKAIESNEQRSAVIIKPNAKQDVLDDFDVFVFYQPTASFTTVYDFVNNKKVGVFTIVGTNTDLVFLNKIQSKFNVNTDYPTQEVLGVLNTSFSRYDVSNFQADNYPPLLNSSGEAIFSGIHESLLSMNIRGVDLSNSLLAITEPDDVKNAVLFGEGIWKWRLQDYRNHQNFENFDQFIGKLILFLSETTTKNRLNIEYKSVYEGVGNAKVNATYFDETFVFDSKAKLVLKLNNTKEIPMLLKGNFYQADLSDLEAGDYNFTVSVEGQKINKSGKFKILDFDVEQQFLASNNNKLENLATNTAGKVFYPEKIGELISELTLGSKYLPTQKSTGKVSSLVDFRLLLALIILSFSLEWFIRKYNGLI
ncbi:VWA domain-containing protein [Cellulophaga baltica]|uniref:vWA domain-containing protein n=1 Tax=Cellulophaga TaxID=104264 RepID=UPI001C06A6DF|nr:MULTISPECIES: vWA domain-containing protein [Cellulophaga]MBU2996202.1 VWA domain-containing protein [Cellulophaga baltica]MDO6767597.1 VWA domain-containing protein [Cellulophaga sp. 1_MG-2023]